MIGKPLGQTENGQSIQTGGRHRHSRKNKDEAKTEHRKLERLETRTLLKTGGCIKVFAMGK